MLRNNLAALQEAGADDVAVREVTRQMNELLYREEMLWAAIQSLLAQGGNQNTKYFYQRCGLAC
jgi:hypothetical protein